MKTFEPIENQQLYVITRSNEDPKRATVLFRRSDPLLATMALNEILNGLGDTYRGVKTVVFVPVDASDADEFWKRHRMGNFIYTGILVMEDASNEPKIYDDDVVTHHALPDDVRRRIINRYCRKTTLDRMDVYLSDGIVHLPRIIKDDAVFEDFRRQAAEFFITGNDVPLLDKYGEQRIRGKAFVLPAYAMVMSARLCIGREVDILQVRQFLRAARQEIVKCNGSRPGATSDTLRSAYKLLKSYPGDIGFQDNSALTRGEALALYRRRLDSYRRAEARWLASDPFERYGKDGEELDDYLLP